MRANHAIITAMLVGLGLAACASRTDQPTADIVAYRISPTEAPGGKIEALRVEIRFRQEADGSTLIHLPRSFAGHGGLWKNLSDLDISGGVIQRGDRPDEIVIAGAPSAEVTFTYRVHSALDHEPRPSDEQPFAPWIFDDWFYLYGPSFLARLDRPDSTPTRFRWSAGPDIRIASNLEHLPAPGAGGGLGAIPRSTLIGGRDLRVLQRGPVRLAIHGRFSFTDDQLAEAAHNIVQKERAFWGDPSAAPFLVTLAPVDGEPGMRGVGGSAFRDAFGAAASPDTPLYRLLLNFAHETFHTGQKGRTSLTETWFVEGFADAYSRVLSLRAGDLSMDEFIDVWNEALVDYANSPARTWPNDRVVAERFSDADADGMPYIRGALLATIWDRRLHNATKGARSLDDVLREHRRATNGASETAGALFAKIAASSGLDISADIATHIDRGEPISLPPDAFGPCIRVDDLAIASFDRGFDAEATMRAGMVASGVRTDGPAHAAGLRDGMKLVRQAGGRFGDSTLDYVWIVQAHGDAEQTLRWRPAGQGELHIQRLVRTDMSPSDARSCALG